MLIGVAMMAGLALYFSQIQADGVSQDEGATARVMGMGLGFYIEHLVFVEPTMAVYYLVLRPWVAVFGTDEVGLRSLTAASATATIPFIYLLAQRLGGRFVAIAAVVLFLVNPFVLQYAVEARSYGLAMLLAAVATWYLWRAAETGGRGRWIAYGVTLTLGIWVHFYAVFVAIAHGAWLWWPGQARRRSGLVTVALGLAASVPLAVAIMLWGPEREWLSMPTVANVSQRLRAIVGSTSPGPIATVLAMAYLGALITNVVVAVRHRVWTRPSEMRQPADDAQSGRVLAVLWVVVPIVAGLAVSLVKPIFIARSLIVIVPALPLVLGSALALLGRRWLAVPALLLVAALSVTQLVAATDPRPDWRGSVAEVAASASDGDAILVYPVRLVWQAVDYYVRRTPELESVRLLNGAETTRQDAPSLIAAATSSRQIWLLIFDGTLRRQPPGLERVLTQLGAQGYRVQRTEQFQGLQLVLFAR